MNLKKIVRQLSTAQQCGFLLFFIALFYAAVCTPVYQWTSTDIAVSDIFILIWDLLQALIRFAFFWITASFVLVSVKQQKNRIAVFLIPAGASLLLHFGSLGVGLLMLPEFENIGADLLDAGISVALDIGQFLLYRLFAFLTVERKPSEALPVSAMISCAAVPSLLEIASRIRYDVAVGAPTGKSDLIVMILYYVIELASIVIGYLAILLITDLLQNRKEQNS